MRTFCMRCGRDLLAFQPWLRDAESLESKISGFGGGRAGDWLLGARRESLGPGVGAASGVVGPSVFTYLVDAANANIDPLYCSVRVLRTSRRQDGKSADHHAVHALSLPPGFPSGSQLAQTWLRTSSSQQTWHVTGETIQGQNDIQFFT